MKVEVDGDVVAFRAGFGAEHMEYNVSYTDKTFEEHVVINCRYKKDADAVADKLRADGQTPEITPERVLEPLAHALHNVGTILNNILHSLDAEKHDMTVWISGPSAENYRMKIGTIKPYKGHRKDAWRPTYEHEIKDYIIAKWNGKVTVGQEADDAMGIAQMKRPFGQSVICTNDKDLDMIPGLHYNFVKDERYVVDEDTADWLFWQQLLTGDSTDNIVGVPGIGEKKAFAALENIWRDKDAMKAKVWDLYVQAYGMAAYPALVENGRLLWIRRKEDELWLPNECT